MQSFRSYKLTTLRLTPLLISERIESNNICIQSIEEGLKYKARSLVFFWSLFISAFCALFIFFTTNNLIFSLTTLAFLLAITFTVTYIPTMINRLISSQRYHHSHAEILELQGDTRTALNAARQYQQHLEINNGPGFIALYEDVIFADDFQSELEPLLLKEMIQSSIEGNGAGIKLDDYTCLLVSLKQQSISESIGLSCIADSIAAQSDDKAVMAFAMLIANEHKNIGVSSLRIAALVGLHSCLSFHFQSFDTRANEHWVLAENIFKDCLEFKTEELLENIQLFQALTSKSHLAKAS